jgi:predicted transcriptional regulator
MAKHHSPLLLPEDIKHMHDALGLTSEEFGNLLGYKSDSIRQLESPDVDWTVSEETVHQIIGIYLGVPKDNIPRYSMNSSQLLLDQTSNRKAC